MILVILEKIRSKRYILRTEVGNKTSRSSTGKEQNEGLIVEITKLISGYVNKNSSIFNLLLI